jgi:hypothetical protein
MSPCVIDLSEECQGHTAESIREQIEQDATRKVQRRGAWRGYKPAKNGREA